MDSTEFRKFANEMVDYIADYLDNIRDRRVLSDVKPEYIRSLIPEHAPDQPESWKDVMKDIDRVIMPGITHWHSPNFYAYFPTANSYPAIVADMLSGAIACIGFSWMSSPACTELETVMLDWLGQMLELPQEFLARSGGKGGGVIQGTASEATLVGLLSARAKTIKRAKEKNPNIDDAEVMTKLVAYSSDQSHSSVQRAGLLGGVKIRILDSDEHYQLKADTLEKAIKEDQANGLIPFYIIATLGTTSSCAFDDLREIGPVCRKYGIWLHVDAAYAGSAFVCPEYRYLLKGVEYAESFNFNPHKWMLVNFDCSAMWVQNANDLVDAFNVDPVYLKHDRQGQVPDYRHWQIPLGRRFRSLKLWFVLRIYGVTGIQAHIRKQISLAHDFEQMVNEDPHFEVVAPVLMGLVCFRLKGSNEMNETLVKTLNANGKIHLVPTKLKGSFVIRLAICSRFTELSDVKLAWKEIQAVAEVISTTTNCITNHH